MSGAHDATPAAGAASSGAQPTATPPSGGSVDRPDVAVVAIGASAGGLDALRRLFSRMPDDSDIAFLVAYQPPAGEDRSVTAALERVTRMPVVAVADATSIAPNHVYLVPPTHTLAMTAGELRLGAADDTVGRHVAIDRLFRCVADVYRERCHGIVLSGSGAAGAVGLMRIKERGGVTFAQSPSDAQFDGMPRAAIATRIVDFVLPADEMPGSIATLVASARSIRLPPVALPMVSSPTPDLSRRAESALDDIKALVRDRTGQDFGHYRPATVIRRIERRLQIRSLHSLPDYRDFLVAHPEETAPLVLDLLMSVTNFFRDRDAFDAFQQAVVPALLADRGAGRTVRVWAPACATGEEAYSLAMLFAEACDRLPNPPDFQIFATDVDDRALAVGRTARYPRSIVADVDLKRLRRHFVRDGESYRVAAALRERVMFARHDVLADPPFPQMDLVCCRNLLVAVDRDAQRAILDAFRFALGTSGLLFLGKGETPNMRPHAFEAVDDAARIYRVPPVVPAAGRHDRSRHDGSAPAGHALTVAADVPSSDEQAHRGALALFAPTSVLIDGSHRIVHLSPGAERHLADLGVGVDRPLLSAVRAELRPTLRTALDEATGTGASVEAAPVALQRDGRRLFVTMTVRPLAARDPRARTLVTFAEVDATVGGRALVDTGTGSIVERVEADLERRTRQLQRRLDRSESSAEALQASNEALQALNDALRATGGSADPDDGSSPSAELALVNRELQDRIEATTRIADDLQELVDSSEIATIFIDEGLRIRRFTPRARDIFRLIPSDLGRPLLDLRHRLRYEVLDADVAEAFRTLRLVEREVDGEGDERFLARILPRRTGPDQVDGATITFVDITRLRSQRNRQQHGETHLRLAAETSRDFAIMTMDFDGIVTAWNQGAERMFGYTAAEIVGRSADILFTPEDRAAGVPERELSNARALGRAEDDRWHLRKDHTRFYCSGVVTPYEAAEGSGLAKIARDITGLRRELVTRDALLSEARTARTAFEASSRLKDQFLAVMSHELKHPLNLIHVNAELLERMPQVRAHASAVRAAQLIRKTVIGQGKIIDDLLDLSRVRTGKLALAIEAVDLGPAIENIVASAASDARDKDITLRLHVDAELGEASCDPVRVEQIAWNLLSNALKFTPAGGRIEVQLQRDGAFARLTVKDSGRGIDASFLPKVFDMFGQDPASRRDGGMGIGLALVSELAHAQGGRVEAQSEGANRGAQFTVWLPLHVAARPPDDAEDAPGRSLAGLRILVVDDAREALEPLVELLQLEGALPMAALDGRAAIQLLDQHDFDLLISDIAMPDMGGYALMAEVRRRPRTAGITAIALTGFGRTRDKQLAAEAGFDAHVTKPASVADLRRALERVALQQR